MAIGFSGLGLRTKLSIVSALLIILTAAGIAGTLVRQEQREARAALENEGVAVLSLLSEAGEAPIIAGNRAALAQILESLAPNRNIAYAVALDVKGNELARRGFLLRDVPSSPNYPGERQPGRIQSTYLQAGSKRILELYAPVLASRQSVANRSDAIGYVRLGLSQEHVDEHMQTYVLSALAIAAIVVLLSLVAVRMLTRRILAPVAVLTEAAEAVGRGDLRVRVPEIDNPEFGNLTHKFNEMTSRLSASQASVEEYQHTLEEKVEQRTREGVATMAAR